MTFKGITKTQILFFIFIITLASDPFITSIEAMLFQYQSTSLGLSFLQISRGFALLIMSTIIFYNYLGYLQFSKLGIPLLCLGIFSMSISCFSPFPMDGITFGIKVLYLYAVFVSAVILTNKEYLNYQFLYKLSFFIASIYFGSQILASYLGYGGLTAYRTDFGSSGFGLKVSMLSLGMLGLLPICFFGKQLKLYDVALIFVIGLSILLTMRRSAFLAFVLILITISLYRMFFQRGSLFSKIFTILFSSLFLTIIWKTIQFTSFGSVFLERLEDLDFSSGGTGSGRIYFQKIGLEYLMTRPLIGTLLGDGAGFSKILLGDTLGVRIGMHSDWLDLAISFGLVGILAYIIFNLSVLRLFLNLNHQKSPGSGSVLAIFIALVFISISTGGTLEISFSMPFALLGYIYSNNIFQLLPGGIINKRTDLYFQAKRKSEGRG